LLASCDAGYVDSVSKLLSAGTCPNKPGEFESTSTPLYQACLHGYLAIVQALLKHDADPNLTIKDTLGVPLVIAASKGHLEVVKALLANGANPDQISAVPNRSLEGRPSHSDNWSISPTALDEASTKGHLEIVRVLLSHHANMMHVIARTCSGIWSPAKVNILELVLEMLSGRGDFENIWKSAVSDRSLAHRDHFIKLLLDYIAPTAEILMLAASCGSIPAVDRCLIRGIDPNIASQDGHLPLASAAHSLHKHVIRRLVSAGANTNALDIKHQTPLLATLDGFKTSLEAPLQNTAQSHHALNVQDIVSCLVEGGAHVMCSDIAAGEVLEVAGSFGSRRCCCCPVSPTRAQRCLDAWNSELSIRRP
jgi:ankyrin repeat protein